MKEKQPCDFTQKLLTLVIPIAFQQFMLALVGASDALMLGMLAQDALSAVSLAGQITFVENLFFAAMSIGLSMLAAQYWGRQDRTAVERIFAYVMKITAAVGKYVSIGDGTYANMNLTLIDDWKITIGKNVLIGPNVTLCTTGHPVHPKHRADRMYSFPVTIGDNVWIGANVVVLLGVTIGKNSVIGAGSVVTKDIPANVIAFGSSCKVYREIDEHDEEYYFKDRRFDSQPENECMEDQ